jgi:LCP family protein required for cell wall assembly
MLLLMAAGALVAGYVRAPLVSRSLIAIGVTGEDKGGKRGDVIAVLLVNPQTQRVAVVRCPRDTRVQREDSEWVRANSLHKDGRLIPWLESRLGIKINRRITIHFVDAARMIDAFGSGLRVDVGPQKLSGFVDSYTGERHGPWGPGVVHLKTGADAVAFARFRGVPGDKKSDVWRIGNQSLIEKALLRKMRSLPRDPQAVLRFKRLWESDIRTDLSFRELAAIGFACRRFNTQSGLRQLRFPGTAGRNGFTLDEDELKFEMAALRRWLDGKPDNAIRVLCDPASREQIATALTATGLQPVISTDSTVTARYLIAPVGQGRRLARLCRQQGLDLPVHESHARKHPMLIYGRE